MWNMQLNKPLPLIHCTIWLAYFLFCFCTCDLKGQTRKCFTLIAVYSTISYNKISVNTTLWFMPSVSQPW